MDLGYVKLWRRIRDGDLMQNHNALILWVWMLTTANWTATSRSPKGVRVDLKPGQLLYGRESTAAAVFMSVQSVRTAFAYLHKTERITSESTSQGTIVTIVNWKTYQPGLDSSNQHTNQHLTSSQPAPNHSEEEKKVKKRTRKRDPIWDSVVDVFNLNPVTKSDQTRIGKVVRDLKAKKATPQLIASAVIRYKREWPNVPCTPFAILSHWERFTTPEGPTRIRQDEQWASQQSDKRRDERRAEDAVALKETQERLAGREAEA